MWRTDRPWAWLALAAFLFRAAAAVATERLAIFPPHYFHDARLIEGWAWEAAEDLTTGRARYWRGSPSQKFLTAGATGVYRLVGRRPLVLKLLVAAASAAAVAALWLLSAPLFGARAATAAALALAAWPSAVFYGSQFLKDPLLSLPVYLFLAACLRLLDRARPTAAAGATAGLLAAAGLRSYLLIPAAAAAATAAAWAWRAGAPPRRAALLAAIAVGVPACYALLSGPFFTHCLPSPPSISSADPTIRAEMIPTSYDSATGEHVRPYTPRGITKFRRYRQGNDQREALDTTGRRIETQIYPDAELETWLDLALFLPKSAFHALFMPLPGLYPLEGKPGRALAAAENVLLLAIVVLAAAGLRSFPLGAGRAALLVFVAVMTAGAALLEFDLGSASRHKLLYLPLLFPFAAEEALRLRRGRRP